MRVWRWYVARGWPARIGLAAAALLVASASGYVAVRSLQYLVAEGDAGIFVPPGAPIQVRARGLATHWERIQGSDAWRVVRRRILREPAVRRALGALLRKSGLPTLDDLEDARRAGPYTESTLMRAAGRDAAIGLFAGDSWGSLRWCAATRLRYTDFLLAPFARFVVRSERVAGRACLRLGTEASPLFVTFEGAVAVASNHPQALEESLRRKGRRVATERPIDGFVSFEGARVLADVRSWIETRAALPAVKPATVRAARVSLDVQGSAVLLDVELDGAEPAVAKPAPSLSRLLPEGLAGYVAVGGGAWELHEGLRRMAGPVVGGRASGDLQVALKMLEDSGFEREVLPRLGPGLGVLTGLTVVGDGNYPAVALLMGSSESAAALEALHACAQKMAGPRGQAKLNGRLVGDVLLQWWEISTALQYSVFLAPCYAALPEGVLVGTHPGFLEAVIETAYGRSRPMGEEARFASMRRRMGDRGIGDGPCALEGALSLPQLRESLEGVMSYVAAQIVYATLDSSRFREEIRQELGQQGRKATEEEIVLLFNAAVDRRKLDQEDALRGMLRPLEGMGWAAIRADAVEGGVRLRAALELR